MNLVLVAPPAAGKGTLSDLLNKKYNLVNISIGQLLRDVDPETDLGKKIREIQKQGLLVDLETTISLLEKRLSEDDVKSGFILDGFPRSVKQSEALIDLERKLGVNVDYVIYLNVSFQLAKKRTLGRLMCPHCKSIHNSLTNFNTPKVENVCNNCGSQLEKRNDDNEESLKKRFDLFNNETYPVVEFYKRLNKLIELDANAENPQMILKELESKINL